jgi:hypothetical protein
MTKGLKMMNRKGCGKKVVVAYFQVISKDLPGKNKEAYEKPIRKA